MEVHSLLLLEKDLPREVKEAIRYAYILTFGPSGIQEQDDGENWSQCAASTRGWIGRNLEFNYQLGLGHEATAEKLVGPGFPGSASTLFSEINQRGFYKRWYELIAGSGKH
jgi:3-phenylpropionate/trans-cinnamate dioxygenase alpha subunit